jgi:tetratricopeptide (TPR) repeat protein
MINKRSFLIVFMLLVSVSGGCAPFANWENFFKSTTFSTKEEAGRHYFQKGREYEAKGDLVAARKQFRLAMTVNPPNQKAMESRNRVEKKLRRTAKRHYRRGLRLYKKGKYGHARHQFLIALRLWPEYPEVVKMLTPRKRLRIKKYIVHTIGQGESLAKVAKKYYGDYEKFPIIAEYNNLSDATQVKVGQKIKVPEIEGIEFLKGKEKVKREDQEFPDPGARDWEEYTSRAKKGDKALDAKETWDVWEIETLEEKEEPPDQIAMNRNLGIDFYKEKKYVEAIALFDEVLKVDPQDRIAFQYAYQSHFDHAMLLFEERDYLSAIDQFEASLRYKEDCMDCYDYIKKSGKSYKEMHYKKGIEFFGKEQLMESIKEWELVSALDPKYKRVDYLINKAKTILKNVKKLKESQKEMLK